MSFRQNAQTNPAIATVKNYPSSKVTPCEKDLSLDAMREELEVSSAELKSARAKLTEVELRLEETRQKVKETEVILGSS